MQLNDAQKAAVEYLEGPLLVLAGPGTGKTQLLSSKVEYILKNTDANPENILCLTYTESGATNMRSRLFSLIGAAASKLHIHTYHAFGSAILAEYKNYAEHFDRNLDAAIDNVTEYKIIKDIQNSLDTFDILKSANTSDLIDTIASAKSARLTGKNLEEIANSNLKDAEELNPKLNACLKKQSRGMKYDAALNEVYQPLMELLQEKASPKPICQNIEREANFLLLELDDIIKTESAKTDGSILDPTTGKPLKPSVSPLTRWKNKRFEKDENGNYRLASRVANKKLLSLAHIMQKYETYLSSSNLYDFADMIQEALTILKEDRGFKLTLEERYQFILLDEFQDTNAAQAELIYRLTDYEQPNIMAVGDDDQAIFAFQGANSSNLVDFQNHYQAKVITLLENYRSNSEILDTSYAIREQIADSFAKKQGIIKRLRAFKSGEAKISRHEFLESSAEYHWVATKIAELKTAGIKQSDIAIITPKHKYVAPLLPFLKDMDLSVSYEKRDNLFEDTQISELLTLSRFIYELTIGHNPAHLLFELLSFPFFEISPLDIVLCVNKVPRKFSLDYLLESDSEKIREIANFLAILAQKSTILPLEQFLDLLIGVTPYDEKKRSSFLAYYTKNQNEYQTFELYEKLAVLREAVLKHYATTSSISNTEQSISIPKLPALIRLVDDYLSAGAAIINTSPYQDSEDAVQILTAHKSKGLEFEYVFIIATDDRAWGNAKGNNNMLSLPQNLISIRHTGITEDERLRLFFVALTRAKSHLYLTNSIKDFSDKNPARLQYLAEYEKDDKVISPYLPEKSREVILHYQENANNSESSDLKNAWLAHYQKPTGDLKAILLKRLESYQLTATDLTNFIDIVYAGPRAFYTEKILRAPDESYSNALTFGNLIHATFEQVTTKQLSDEQALDFYSEALARTNAPDEDLEDLRERGTASLRASLKAFGSLLRAKGAKAELNFYHDHLALPATSLSKPNTSIQSTSPALTDTLTPSAIPLTGKIDHLNIDHDNKTIEIYDFKTSGFKDKKWDSHPTLYKYKLQLGFYKLLLNLSPEFKNYKIEKAHILFVVPDSLDTKVHDKIYEFNDRDEKELKELIFSVYQHIKTLDFTDDPKLFLGSDSSRNIKDILEFIERLRYPTTQK